MSDDTMDLELIETAELTTVTGGDGWSNYKHKLSQDVKDTGSRAKTAIHYNAVNGHWNAGKFADNAAGTIFDGGKTAVDAVGGLFGLLK